MSETALPSRSLSVEDLEARVGQEIGLSDWHEITQDLIDRFADVTGDDQFIHVDPARAAAETPFSGTIAHGFLTLSLLSQFGREALPAIKGRAMGINYGFDQIRFLSPVRCGARVRGHFTLASLDRRTERQILFRYAVTVEIEGLSKPALSAQWLTLAVMN
jgi:acyl dehydratase